MKLKYFESGCFDFSDPPFLISKFCKKTAILNPPFSIFKFLKRHFLVKVEYFEICSFKLSDPPFLISKLWHHIWIQRPHTSYSSTGHRETIARPRARSRERQRRASFCCTAEPWNLLNWDRLVNCFVILRGFLSSSCNLWRTCFVFQNSLSVSLHKKPTTMKSIKACESKPNRDWWSCDVFTCCWRFIELPDVVAIGSNSFAVTRSSSWSFGSNGVRLLVAIEATWFSLRKPPRTCGVRSMVIFFSFWITGLNFVFIF